MLTRLRLSMYVQAGECFHIAVAHVAKGAARLHRQDFSEIFWVESGTGWHELPQSRIPLGPGTIGFVSADVVHGFGSDANLVFGNLAFSDATRRDYEKRYFGGRANCRASPWASAGWAANACRLGPLALARVCGAAAELARGNRTRLALDRFVLDLFRHLECAAEQTDRRTPDWLSSACEAFGKSGHLAGGLPRFFELAGRRPEHVAREMRRFLGVTPRDFVRERQLRHAGERLLMTDAQIIEIAADCGFENLSHFYKCFRKQHGMPPRQYRLHGQQPALGG